MTVKPHCRWCAFETWLFEDSSNVVVVLISVLGGVFGLATLVTLACVAGTTLAGP